MSLLMIILIVLVILVLLNATGNGPILAGGNLGNLNMNDSKTWLIILGVIVLIWLLFFRTPGPEYFRQQMGGRMNGMHMPPQHMPNNNRWKMHAEEEEEHQSHGGGCNAPYENQQGNGYPMW